VGVAAIAFFPWSASGNTNTSSSSSSFSAETNISGAYRTAAAASSVFTNSTGKDDDGTNTTHRSTCGRHTGIYLVSKPVAMLTENRIALCPKSKDDMKCYKAAIETAITLYNEKKKSVLSNGKTVPDGFVDSCIDKAMQEHNVEHMKRITKATLTLR
jgi:hypothetical protein